MNHQTDGIDSKAAQAFTDSHVTFITHPDPAQGTNKHLRIGGQSKILMYNRESDDATLPDLSLKVLQRPSQFQSTAGAASSTTWAPTEASRPGSMALLSQG